MVTLALEIPSLTQDKTAQTFMATETPAPSCARPAIHDVTLPVCTPPSSGS